MNQWYPVRHCIFDEAYKVRYLLLLWLLLPLTSEADCGHGNNPCEVPGPPGPQGEQGPPGESIKGDTGAPGIDGIGIAGTNGLDGKAGKNWDDEDYWTDDEVAEMFAASTAMAGLDFDSTTTKTQIGIAIGGYDGEENMAIGIGKVWDSQRVGDVLFSFKTTVDEVGRGDARPWVGSAVWKF